MRVLYGVTGEGLGHAMRSRVMIEHLRDRGHEVVVAASGRAYDYLSARSRRGGDAREGDDRGGDDRGGDDHAGDGRDEGGDGGGGAVTVYRIPGFAMAYRDGRVARVRTVARLGRGARWGRGAREAVREAVGLYRRAISGFQPDVCVSDFDSFSHVFGKLFDRPVISLDHQHVIDRCRHAREIKRGLPRDFRLTKAFVRAKLPGCAHYVVTSFFFPEVKRERTTLVGPILRPEIAGLLPTEGEHVLVYQTGVAGPELLEALAAVPEQRFVVYARGGEAGGSGNVRLRAFDERRFLRDLASARGVIANGGYTLMSEALCLGKPVLSVPLRHQGEQELNSAYLAGLGLGATVRRLDAAAIRAFVRSPPRVVPIVPGNVRAFETIDRLLEEVR